MQYLLLVIALAVAVVLSARYVPMRENSSGTPGLVPEQLERMAPEGLTERAMPGGQPAGSGGETFYRWRTDDGSWQYGDHPPPGVDDFEQVEVDPVTTKPADQLRGGTESSGEGTSP